eukprot:UN31397
MKEDHDLLLILLGSMHEELEIKRKEISDLKSGTLPKLKLNNLNHNNNKITPSNINKSVSPTQTQIVKTSLKSNSISSNSQSQSTNSSTERLNNQHNQPLEKGVQNMSLSNNLNNNNISGNVQTTERMLDEKQLDNPPEDLGTNIQPREIHQNQSTMSKPERLGIIKITIIRLIIV